MISNRELKDQIEQLTEQNQSLSSELQQIKDMLQKQNSQGQGNRGGEGGQNEQQSQDGQDSKQNQHGGGQSNQNGMAQIANDFLKLKDMTSQLEIKLQNFVSGQSSGKSLNQEDVIQLIISMMNGMIDWTTDFVAKQQKTSGQMQ